MDLSVFITPENFLAALSEKEFISERLLARKILRGTTSFPNVVQQIMKETGQPEKMATKMILRFVEDLGYRLAAQGLVESGGKGFRKHSTSAQDAVRDFDTFCDGHGIEATATVDKNDFVEVVMHIDAFKKFLDTIR